MIQAFLSAFLTAAAALAPQSHQPPLASTNPKTAPRTSRATAAPQRQRAAAAPAPLASSPALSSNDDCSTPATVNGTGTFSFDTTNATTGSEGQAEPLCATWFGIPDIENDVWFKWVAPASGIAQVSTCNLTSVDTKIAAYAGGGCPVAGTALACEEDSCFSQQTEILFPVSAGSTYTIQLGNFPGAGGGPGQFALNVLQPPANDDCNAPVVIAGQGTFAFDTTVASMGSEGQSEALCAAQYGQYWIDRDLWYTWTAPASGLVLIETCGLTALDTKIALYPGSGCPTNGTALACADDTCASGLQATVVAPVNAGSTYTIQIGGHTATGQGGPGVFSITVAQAPANDDCTTPAAIAGLGSFPYDTRLATTGALGQAEALCGIYYGGPAVENDLWYSWTAPASGCTLVDSCSQPQVYTKIAVYQGGSCPAGGTCVACSADGCSNAASARFDATAGQVYLIQLGAPPTRPASVGTFSISQPGGGVGNDECSGATVISGPGFFAFDNSPGLATTGCEGQNESLCAAVSAMRPQIEDDVWFQWTATQTGFAVFDSCGLTSITPKVAVYQGAGCPTPGSALTCAMGGCAGAETVAVWACTAGSTYTIQLGNFPGNTGGAGQFSMSVVPPAPNDDCTGAQLLGPVGPYPFTLIGTTTSANGQSELLCNSNGYTAIENDLWFTWIAPASGRASASLCLSTSWFNSKLAVYAGTGCPAPGSALACNDDCCSILSQTNFDVIAGQAYTIQVGEVPGWPIPVTNGLLDITVSASTSACTWDDGSTETLLGWLNGGDIVWLNRFGSAGTNTQLASVDLMWGSATWAGMNPASSGRFASDVFVWLDGPSQDGDPSDATLLYSIPVTIGVWDTDTYVTIPVPPVAISGVFFVGSHQEHYGYSGAGPTELVVPLDMGCPNPGIAWIFGNDGGVGSSPVDYANPANNVWAPYALSTVGYSSQVCIRAGCNNTPATYLCDPGSGGTIACPCANPPAGAGRGCNNSSNTGGATLNALGTNSLAAPTLHFSTAGEKPTATSVLLQGSAANAGGLVFGQGVRCAAGSLKRLFVRQASGGSVTLPNFAAGDSDIPARAAQLGSPIGAGQTCWYLVYYRDPIVLGGCPAASTFNGTNTAQVTWQP